MIIHSVTPAELLLPPQEMPADDIYPFKGGYISGRSSADGFTISRIISTNPGVYLDKRYAPGQSIRLPGK